MIATLVRPQPVDSTQALWYAVLALVLLFVLDILWFVVSRVFGPTVRYLREHWRKMLAWHLINWSTRLEPAVLSTICSEVVRSYAAEIGTAQQATRSGPWAEAETTNA